MGQEYLLPWEQILYLMNGTDVNGYPLSASLFTLHEVTEEHTIKTRQEFEMVETPVTVSMSGGCAVAAFNFPKKEKENFERVYTLCRNWLKNIEDPADDDKLLSLIITPLLMEGTFSLLLTNLVFAEGYDTGEDFRLILCFDNEQTQPYILEGADITKMVYEIDLQLNREIDEIRRSIDEAEELEKQYKNDNLYEKNLMEKMSTITPHRENETEDSGYYTSGIRATDEEDEV